MDARNNKENPKTRKRGRRIKNRVAKRLRMSSDSDSCSRSPICRDCGHRCCLKRFETKYRKKYTRTKRIVKRTYKKQPARDIPCPESEAVQAGSRCAMLSPLFVQSNALPDSDFSDTDTGYQKVTPEMIYETVSKLMKWRQFVLTRDIQEHMMRNYPVNRDTTQFLGELTEKLLIAKKVGFLMQEGTEHWTLSGPLQERELSKNHVTLFWEIYNDTMRPVTKKPEVENKCEEKEQNTQT